VFKEGEGEFGVGPDPGQPVLGVDGGLFDGVGAEVGQFARLQVAPDVFPGLVICGRWQYISAVTGGRLIATNTNSPYLIVGTRRFMPPVPQRGRNR